MAGLPISKSTHAATQTHTAKKPALKARTPAQAAAQTSAQAILGQFLDGFGLGALATWAWQTYTNAGGGDTGMKLVQAELPNQAAYKARFPAIESRVKAGLSAMTPAEYLDYEQKLRESFTSHGLAMPVSGAGFNDIVTGLLNHDVSLSEVVNDRIGTALTRVQNAPIEVRQAAERLWGVHGDKALASLYLSPDHSSAELEKMSQAMDVAGHVAQMGFGISKERALRLADVGADSQLPKLQELARMRGLFNANVGEDPNLTAEQQGLAATFGEDGTSQAAIDRRLMARKAALSGSGGPTVTQKYSTTDQGLSGLGSGSGG